MVLLPRNLVLITVERSEQSFGPETRDKLPTRNRESLIVNRSNVGPVDSDCDCVSALARQRGNWPLWPGLAWNIPPPPPPQAHALTVTAPSFKGRVAVDFVLQGQRRADTAHRTRPAPTEPPPHLSDETQTRGGRNGSRPSNPGAQRALLSVARQTGSERHARGQNSRFRALIASRLG